MSCPTLPVCAPKSSIAAALTRICPAVVALLPFLCSPAARAQSFFPAACATLRAEVEIRAGAPVTDTPERTSADTARIEAALNACPAGRAVELTAGNDGAAAFLLAPIHLPAGVTLLVDAGVTVYASRNPADFATGLPPVGDAPCGPAGCKPLIRADAGAPSMPSGLMGFGTVDGRGDSTLLPKSDNLPSGASWYDLPAANRPELVLANAAMTLSGITLRNGPAEAIRFTGIRGLSLYDVNIVTSPRAGGSGRGILLAAPEAQATVHGGSISVPGADLLLAPDSLVDGAGTRLYSGEGVLPELPGQNHCVLSSKLGWSCTPASLPRAVGALFLQTADATNLQAAAGSGTVTATAVLTGMEAAGAQPAGVVTFLDGGVPIGSAMLENGLARLVLPPWTAGDHRLTAEFDGADFGEVIVHSEAKAAGAQPTSGGPGLAAAGAAHAAASGGAVSSGLSLSADAASLPVRTVLHLTAFAGAGATGSVSFGADGVSLATVPVDSNGNASLGVASLLAGTHSLTSSYSGDSLHPAAGSAPLTVMVTVVPASFTVSASPATIIAGTPLTLGAAGLPPDATGTITYSDPNGPFATASISSTAAPVLTSFGDSITAGATVALSSEKYPFLVAASLGGTAQDFGISGIGSCDVMTLEMLANKVSPNQSNGLLSSVMIGTNDAYDLALEPTYKLCHQAALAWLGTPREYKVLAGDAAATPLSGSWQVHNTLPLDSTWGTLYSSASDATARFALTTSGGPVYLWYLLDGNNTASTFRVSIDGVPTGTLYGAGSLSPFWLNSATRQGIALLRLSAAAGPHTIDVTVAAGPVGILGVGTPPSAGGASVHPLVVAANPPSQSSTGARDTAVSLAAYGADALADAMLLAGDGLNILWAENSTFLTGDPADYTDGLHPDASGHLKLAAAFEAALAGVSMQPYSVLSNSVPAATGTLQGSGVHGVFGTYSGDAHYAVSDSPGIPVIVQDPYTNAFLAASATAVGYGVPVQFTASVQPAGSQGSFNLLDFGTTYLGTAEITSDAGTGTASLILPMGPHSVTAVYSSTDGRQSSTSAPLAVTVDRQPTVLSLASSAATMVYGGSMQLSVDVNPLAATGTVTFVDSVVGSLGQATLNQGVATITTVPLGAGDHRLTATYAGDTLRLPGTSAPVALHVASLQPAVTAFNLTPSTTFGAPMTVQVSLLGTGTPTPQPAVNRFSAALNKTTAFMGDSVTAWWPMPVNNLGVVGETCAAMQSRFAADVLNQRFERVVLLCGTNDILHTGNDVPTTMSSIQAMAAMATANHLPIVLATILPIQLSTDMNTRALALNAAITAYAQQMGFPLLDYYTSMALHPDYQGDEVHPDPRGYTLMESVLADTLLVPTGTVALADGTTATLSATGTATLSTTTLAAGTQTIPVSYGGDPNFTRTSAAVSVIVGQAASLTALQAQALVSYTGSTALLTATVSSTAATGATGAVTFSDGSRILGSAPLSAGGTASMTTTGALTNGVHSFTAAYGGDGNFSGSSSPAASLNVRYVNTTLSLSAARTSYGYSDTVTLNAALYPNTGSGTISFLDGTQVLAQVPVTGGGASFSTASLALGTHTLTASYSGDSYDAGAQSPSLSLTVGTRPTTLTLSGLAPTATYGTALSVQATVTPAAASGSVTLTDSFVAAGQSTAQTLALGTVTLASGAATLPLPSPGVGTHSISAVYAGDSVDQGANSTAVTTMIAPVSTTLAVELSAATVAFGSGETFTVSVTPADAAGTVTLRDSVAGQLGQATLSQGTATFRNAALTPGLHSINASYSGETTHAASTSPAVGMTVTLAGSTVVLAAPATLYAGNPLSLSASVQPATATGTVLFRDSTQGVLGQAAANNGAATLTLPGLAVGSYSVSASYGGDADFSPSVSGSAPVQVQLNPSATTLGSLPASVSYTTPLTLSAAVTPVTATGTVSFFDGPTLLGSITLANGVATTHVSTLAVGNHSLRASFGGNSVVAASAATANIVITDDNTSTVLTLSQTTVLAGAPISFNMQVSSTVQGGAPTGSVTVRSGSTVLGSAVLAHGSGSMAYATLTLHTTSLGLGTFAVAAFYSGDSTDTLSDSSGTPLSFNVVPASTSASLQLSATTVAVAVPVNVTSMLKSANGMVPTGSMTFYSNNIAFATVPVDAGGSATAVLSAPGIGSFAVTAMYNPTGLFAVSAAPTETLVVTGPLTVAFASPSIDVAAGTTGAAGLTLTPLSGFRGAVAVSCTSPVAYLTCTVQAPSAITSSTPVGATLRLTVAKSLAAARTPSGPGGRSVLPWSCGALFGLLLVPFAGRGRAGRLRAACLALVLLVFTITVGGVTGCGTGGNFFTVPTGAQTVSVATTAAGVTVVSSISVNVTQ